MELDLTIIFMLCLVYLCTGCMDGIAGGGGLITVPALLLAGVPPDMALGTNKLAVVFGCGASFGTYARSGMVFWPLARMSLPLSLIAAFAGTWSILLFNSEDIGRVIVFLLPLAFAATLMPQKDRGITEFPPPPQGFAPLAICAALGFYDGFFGPGSGAFYILSFHLILNLGLLHASATSKLFSLVTITASFLVFAWHGKVLYLLAIPISLANIAGNILGAKMAMRVGPGIVRKALAVSITLLFISLLWKFYLA